MTGSNPLDWYGTAFLIFYGLCFVGCQLLGHLIAEVLRPDGSEGIVDDPDELAIMSNRQEQRVAESAVARMLENGALSLDGKRFARGNGNPSGAMEGAIAGTGSRPRWRDILLAVKLQGERIRERLIMRGLMMSRGDARSLGLKAAIPIIALFAFGIAKVFVGVERDRPVGMLIAFLIITAIFIAGRLFGTDQRTRAGRRALKDARSRHARLRIAPRGTETGTAVALFGTGVLATGPLGDFHRLRQSTGGDGTGDSGDGDGGCGGGCGGCGG